MSLAPWRAAGLSLCVALLSGCASFTSQFGNPISEAKAALGALVPGQQAQGRLVAEYKLVVLAPDATLRDLLSEHLDLARFRDAPEDQRLGSQELARLTKAAPEQAQALLETQGYFNAQVVATRDTSQTPIVVTVSVTPGPRTTVGKLKLNFRGEVAAGLVQASSPSTPAADPDDPDKSSAATNPASPAAPAESTTASSTGPAAESTNAGAATAATPSTTTSATLSATEQAANQAKEAQAERVRQTLQQNWRLKEGQAFVQGDWSSAKSALLTQARAQGYPQAKLESSSADIDTEHNNAELNLVMDSGPLYRLGDLRIQGLKHQPREVVERLAGYQVGEPYTERALLDFQERLIKTTLFDNATVSIRPEAGGPTLAPVWVEVREAPRQQLTASLGFSTGNGPRLGLDYTHRKPLGLNMRSRIKLNVSQKNPWLDWELSSHPRTDMQRDLAALFAERVPEGEKVTINLRARLGRLRETLQDDRIYFLEVLRARETDPQRVVSSGAVSANIQWTRRRVDSTLKPSDGYTVSLLLGLGRADNSVASSGAFGRSELVLHGYKPLPGGWFGNARMNWSQVYAQPQVGLPEALRYRAGGDDSVRGYGLHDLGPVDANGNPTGGKVMWTGSIELAHAFTATLPDLMGAAFVDAGHTAMNWAELRPTLASGLGLRYRSPLGTLRLDYAHAHATGKWRLHFSVGIAL
ncbi:BamA/TamA family outer membrane protein [Roseateles sp. PN1]|uniref:BamA/TamA family outer membrane protein n=1 Tax=Roseateles sp. PN1 TaxID=3137372 RepID=UPI0031391BE0